LQQDVGSHCVGGKVFAHGIPREAGRFRPEEGTAVQGLCPVASFPEAP
jgi:hypothetical protein